MIEVPIFLHHDSRVPQVRRVRELSASKAPQHFVQCHCVFSWLQNAPSVNNFPRDAHGREWRKLDRLT